MPLASWRDIRSPLMHLTVCASVVLLKSANRQTWCLHAMPLLLAARASSLFAL